MDFTVIHISSLENTVYTCVRECNVAEQFGANLEHLNHIYTTSGSGKQMRSELIII